MRVWDRKGGDDEKGAWVEMASLNAKEACKHDPKRYSLDDPNAKKPEPVEQIDNRQAVPLEIPQDWASLPWPERKRLATKLGAEKNVTSDAAAIIISAEINRRSKFKPPIEPEVESQPTDPVEPGAENEAPVSQP